MDQRIEKIKTQAQNGLKLVNDCHNTIKQDIGKNRDFNAVSSMNSALIYAIANFELIIKIAEGEEE